ncbi:MAG: hypothetical protein AAGF11_18290 [Myxococcota bacterium]
MLAFRPQALTDEEHDHLAKHQASIDALPSYTHRVKAATSRWNAASLGTARDKLKSARPGRDRCVFCEDSEGRDVEHSRPRSLFPEATWRWQNLVCACGSCNGSKGSRHAILTKPGKYQEVTRRRKDPVVPPQFGPSAWIDPRREDPMALLELDITGESFYFLPRDGLTPRDLARIEWTVEQCLELNKRESLVQARRHAFTNYRARLFEYVQRSRRVQR